MIQNMPAGRCTHGGDVRRLAARAGLRPEELVDFSASINPLGPPPWLAGEVAAGLSDVARYPDPEAAEFVRAACERFRVRPGEVVAGNGASELLPAVCRLAAGRGLSRAVILAPAYVDMERCCRLAGLAVENRIATAAEGFAPDLSSLAGVLGRPALVLLASPNNPTGVCVPARRVRDLARAFPKCFFLVDESFADFVPGMEDEAAGGAGRLAPERPENVAVLASLTKFYAVPGLRLGLAFAAPEVAEGLRRMLPAWNVGTLGQRVGARCLRDAGFRERTVREVAALRGDLMRGLAAIPGLRVFPGAANFLLCRLERPNAAASELAERLLEEGLAVRTCGDFAGLDDTYFRAAVRTAGENARLVAALARLSGMREAPGRTAGGPDASPGRTAPAVSRKGGRRKGGRRPPPALMVQGTCSSAGKSVLAAGLCRILLEDGWDVAPFKAQNMSNNSAVTPDGREIGRAQATQAQACRLALDARMNPVLLKPTGDTGSQVVILGRPVGQMTAREYYAYRPEAWKAAAAAYDSLAAEHEVMVLEGAGSPAEVNLKDKDIANMAAARHAGARVLLVGDIDRGGVFAALAGTFDILDPAERSLVLGHVLNKFRGDASLLDSGLDFLLRRTGRPVLGVVPWLPALALPEEDSEGIRNMVVVDAAKRSDALDIAVVVPQRIANFNDLDPLAAEPDVRLRLVTSAAGLGTPDAVVLPGSKNTIDDMRALASAGFAAALRALPEGSAVVGICAGLQMLGRRVDDPLGLESAGKTAEGFGLLPLATELKREKTLTRVDLTAPRTGCAVRGYEIHHGSTTLLDSGAAEPLLLAPGGRPLAFGLSDARRRRSGFPRVWGAYVHGIFDADGFRRAFLDALRTARGLAPLGAPQTRFGLEPAIERLASALREHLDIRRIKEALGLAH